MNPNPAFDSRPWKANATTPLPSILFNIGKIHFVSKRWDEVIKSFNQAKERMAHENDVLRQLNDFKLMLCEPGRGDRDKFEAWAANNSHVRGTPLAEYNKVVRSLQAEDPNAAREALVKINELFPGAETRAVWRDTISEFGYMMPDWEK
jgi:hypothetical protein